MGCNVKMIIVEVEYIVEFGEIFLEVVYLFGIYVKCVIQSMVEKNIEKYIFVKEEGEEIGKVVVFGSGDIVVKCECIVCCVVKEFKNGMYVNLGIGMFMFVFSFVDFSVEVIFQFENGIFGLGFYFKKGQEDFDFINVGKEIVIFKFGVFVFGSEESFGMICSGCIDLIIFGVMQVSVIGDFVNWMLFGKVKGFGGVMDFVSNFSKIKVVVIMEYIDKKGNVKIVKQCVFFLIGCVCVLRIIIEFVSIVL